ncbi:hypothetical protein [uncultured Amnibacterium sp.]|uniref:hypothetical protein n=1 Tax=uncultured Amnibacterium sp. TaxID=1631851 RepID=UPI0035CACBC3
MNTELKTLALLQMRGEILNLPPPSSRRRLAERAIAIMGIELDDVRAAETARILESQEQASLDISSALDAKEVVSFDELDEIRKLHALTKGQLNRVVGILIEDGTAAYVGSGYAKAPDEEQLQRELISQ